MPTLPEDLDRVLHDLRGPLNAMAMHAEVLKRAVQDPVAMESVRTIRHEVDRLAALLGTAMEVLAIEPGLPQRIGLRIVVERALQGAALKDVVVASGTWPDTRGDPALLSRAAALLIQNALDATHAAGAGTPPPEVSAGQETDGRVALVVRDFGAGFRSTSPKVLIRLRMPATSGRPTGGLLVAQRIARLHGGALRFHAPGVGAQVSLVLPAGA